MGKTRIAVHNLPDQKNEKNLWIRSWTVSSEESKTQFHTRAGRVWTSIVDRCTLGTKAQESAKAYIGCSIGFSNFQEFAEWCQLQEGYLNKEPNGNYWCIDKDILIPGNKVYGPDTCIFVPCKVNNLFVYGDKSKKGYPVGVSLRPGCTTFTMTCRRNNKEHIRAGYSTVEDAHRAWQLNKISDILVQAEMPSTPQKLKIALVHRAKLIEEEYRNGIFTINR